MSELVKDVEAPLKLKAHWREESGKLEIILDGTDFDFFLITCDVVFDKTSKVLKLTNLRRESYNKSNILFRMKYRVTKDFIICTSYSSPLRRYQPNDNIRVATLMIWAKRSGKYLGDGTSYRLENIGHADTLFAMTVNDHN